MTADVDEPTMRIDSTAAESTPASRSETQLQNGASDRISMPMTIGPKSS